MQGCHKGQSGGKRRGNKEKCEYIGALLGRKIKPYISTRRGFGEIRVVSGKSVGVQR